MKKVFIAIVITMSFSMVAKSQSQEINPVFKAKCDNLLNYIEAAHQASPTHMDLSGIETFANAVIKDSHFNSEWSVYGTIAATQRQDVPIQCIILAMANFATCATTCTKGHYTSSGAWMEGTCVLCAPNFLIHLDSCYGIN